MSINDLVNKEKAKEESEKKAYDEWQKKAVIAINNLFLTLKPDLTTLGEHFFGANHFKVYSKIDFEKKPYRFADGYFIVEEKEWINVEKEDGVNYIIKNRKKTEFKGTISSITSAVISGKAKRVLFFLAQYNYLDILVQDQTIAGSRLVYLVDDDRIQNRFQRILRLGSILVLKDDYKDLHKELKKMWNYWYF